MADLTLQKAFALAVEHQRAGRNAEAAQVYGQILTVHPNQPDALHLLGVLMHELGDVNAGMQLIAQAIIENPQVADYYCNLGVLFAAKNLWDDAINAYRQALKLKPDYVQAYSNLGKALLEQSKYSEAIDAFRWSMSLRPANPRAYLDLSMALIQSGDIDGAIDSARQAVALDPDLPDAHNDLGVALLRKRNGEEARQEFESALSLRPGFAQAAFNLGLALQRLRLNDKAVDQFRQALRLMPQNATWHYQLGMALQALGRLDEAIHFYRQALTLQHDLAPALLNLGNALREQGETDAAIKQFRAALAADEHLLTAASNILFALHAHPDYDAAALGREHRLWAQRYATPLKEQIRPHSNDRTPDRRLRIGYVSPDFSAHVVGRNLLPLLKNHDHRNFEIFCYSSAEFPDDYTEHIRATADQWRDVLDLDDERLAQIVRDDHIDILVDLTLHTGGNRLLCFARKPAPVQATWLGYCSTTGLDTIDYRLSDPYMDPPDSNTTVYTEKTLRLPHTFWCYNVPDPTPPVEAPPALQAGYITFGCLNAFTKVTGPALDLWARVLAAVPSSRMLIHLKPGAHMLEVKKRFRRRGVPIERVEFAESYPRDLYYQVYNAIDVSLDPFPYGGGITSCDSIWMGVPVVTLRGGTAVGRGGCSVLSNVGVPQLIAESPEQYLQIATALAGDLDHLSDLRAGLRQRMNASPLTDGPQFARDVEAAYRQMWLNYCRA